MSEPTPTPRTDVVTFKAKSVAPTNEVVPASHARQLERELTAALSQLSALKEGAGTRARLADGTRFHNNREEG